MTQLIRWTPFRELDRVFDEDFFGPILQRFRAPDVDLYETDSEVVAEVAIPGMDPKKVNVEIENNVLHIRGEIRSGIFNRSIRIPTGIDVDRITAIYEYGILKIAMPKSEKAKPKKVSVEVK